MRRFLILLLASLLLIALPSSMDLRAQDVGATIKGFVWEANFKGERLGPLAGATVFITDAFWLPVKGIPYKVKTNELGYFEFKGLVPEAKYYVYAFHDDPNTPGFDYIPTYTEKPIFIAEPREVKTIDFYMLPGASVIIKGDIYYFESKEKSQRQRYIPVSSLTRKPLEVGIFHLNTYGEFHHTWYFRREGAGLGIYSRDGYTTVVVPANISVDINASDVWVLSWRVGYLKSISFLIDNFGKHFNLPQGGLTEILVDSYALKVSISHASLRVDEVEDILRKAEGIGFYVTAEFEDLARARRLISDAEKIWLVKGVRHEKDGALAEAKIAYMTCIGNLWSVDITLKIITDVRLPMMKDVAKAGSLILPAFLSSYAIALAFFFFETDRKKLIFTCVIYAIILGAFYNIYPGVRVVDLTLFIGSASLCLAVGVFIAFITPRLIKEHEVAGRTPKRGVIAVTFSIAKRYAKRRGPRSILTMISIAALILSFTALTSIASVYGLLTERVNITPPYEGVLVNNLHENKTMLAIEHFIGIDRGFIDWLKAVEGVDVESIAPKAENVPRLEQIGALITQKGDILPIFGVIGVEPKAEAVITRIPSLLEIKDENSIIIDRALAKIYGIMKGASLQLYSYNPALKKYEAWRNVTVAAFIDSDELNAAKELSEDPLERGRTALFQARRLKVVGGVHRLVPCGSNETIIMHWQTALQFPPIVKETGLSAIVKISRVSFKVIDPALYDKVATDIAQRGYHVWTSYGGVFKHYHFGIKLEIRGVEYMIAPLTIVALTVVTTMLSIVHERRKEINVYTAVGFNPSNVAWLFISESIIMGLVAGGFGYILGLAAYRAMALLPVEQRFVVSPKLEWYWSVIGVVMAIVVAILSSSKPATKAAMLAVPSLVKKAKVEEKERWRRLEEAVKATAPRSYLMPLRVHVNEAPFFFSYLTDILKELEGRYGEYVEKISESEEIVEGVNIKHIRFTYGYTTPKGRMVFINRFIARQRPGADYYSLELFSTPETPGIPETYRDHMISYFREVVLEWTRRKRMI